MKPIIIISIILVCLNNASAQFAEDEEFYFSGELSFGNYIGMDLNLNYIYKNKFSFKAGYFGNVSVAKSKPEDFDNGVVDVLLLGLNSPFDGMDCYQLGIGKLYTIDKKGAIELIYL